MTASIVPATLSRRQQLDADLQAAAAECARWHAAAERWNWTHGDKALADAIRNWRAASTRYGKLLAKLPAVQP